MVMMLVFCRQADVTSTMGPGSRYRRIFETGKSAFVGRLGIPLLLALMARSAYASKVMGSKGLPAASREGARRAWRGPGAAPRALLSQPGTAAYSFLVHAFRFGVPIPAVRLMR